MQIIAVDDVELMLEVLTDSIREAAPEDELRSFLTAQDALQFARTHTVDVAFLDIQLQDESGIELGKQLKAIDPKTNIIFCTGFDDYAYEALHDVRATGYLSKPIKSEDIAEELKHLTRPLERNPRKPDTVFIRCFGQFDLFYQGQPVQFHNSKTKELLAYLVDRKGALCTTRQIESVLWEDGEDHRKYLSKIRTDLNTTLEQLSLSYIVDAPAGGRQLSIRMDQVQCDYYQWLQNDPEGIRAFFGEYMEQYSWAEDTKAQITMKGYEEG